MATNSKIARIIGLWYTVLTVCLFLFLTTGKLIGFMSVSWWWVTAPLWGSFVLALVIAALVMWSVNKYDDATRGF